MSVYYGENFVKCEYCNGTGAIRAPFECAPPFRCGMCGGWGSFALVASTSTAATTPIIEIQPVNMAS